MTAKDYLQQIQTIKRKVERLEGERAALRSDLYSVRSAAASLGNIHVQSSSGGDRVSRLLHRIEAIDESILNEIDGLLDTRQTIIGQIGEIHNERLEEILFLRYVECAKWDTISRRLYTDIRYVYRLHNQALVVFSEAFASVLSADPGAATGSGGAERNA